jgi:GT2 family glycosyltransferase
MPETSEIPPAPRVTAVLVSHDGAAWLPEVLAALAAQERSPDVLVAVDTGSIDGSVQLLTAALGDAALVRLSRRTGLGAAITAGLAAAGQPAAGSAGAEWIWLLHDDSAPEPAALGALLAEAAISPGAGVIGPKVLDWDDPRRLVEVGVSIDGAGRRVTGLDPDEIDQGQWDSVRDVLAVGTAGALVRRTVWEELGGLDRRLPLLYDDVDFGWRATLAGVRVLVAPRARVRHARALLTGRRRVSAVRATRARARRHGTFVRLADASLPSLLWLTPLMTTGAVTRAAGLLLTRRPRAAGAELFGPLAALLAVGPLLAARRRRAPLRRAPAGSVRPLLAPPGAAVRGALATLGDRIAGTPGAPPASGAFESGPGDDLDELPAPGASLGRLLVRPGPLVVAGLLAVGLVAGRHLLGPGPLEGGRLLPVPSSAGALWSSWWASWHQAGLGSADPASPWTPWVAAAGTLLGGSAAFAITALLVLALPLAGLSAYLAARALRVSPGVRAVAGGRFDVVVAVVAIPALLACGGRLLAADPSGGGWRRAFALGLGLAVTVSFAPQLAPPAAALLLLGAAAALAARVPGAARRAAAAVIALAVPAALLAPFTRQVIADPRLLLTGLGVRGGVAGTTVASERAVDLLLVHPGGAPLARWTVALAVPLLLAALIGLLRQRRGIALASVGVALVGWGTAIADGRLATAPGHASPAVGIALACAGLVGAALVAGDRARAALAGRAFGFGQPLAVLVAAAVLFAPVVAAAVLLDHGVGGALQRRPTPAIPGFVVSEEALHPGVRVLVLSGAPGARAAVRYWAGPGAGPVFGDEDLASPAAGRRLLQAVVRDLAAPLGVDVAGALAALDVRYVVAPAPVAPRLTAAVDDQPGLTPLRAPSGALWQVSVPGARAELLAGHLAAAALRPVAADAPVSDVGPTPALLAASPPRRLLTAGAGLHATVPAGGAGRVVVLAQAADGGWRATLGGHPLRGVRAWGWSQAFLIPATTSAEHLVITHPAAGLHRDRVLQIAGLALLLILAAPAAGRARRGVLP